jgi:hypothetical protein
MNLKVRAVFFILRRHNNKWPVVFRGNHLWLLINLSRASRHHVQGVFSVLHQNAFAQNPSPFIGLLIGGNVMNFCVCSFVISEVSRMVETCRSKVHYIWLYLCQKLRRLLCLCCASNVKFSDGPSSLQQRRLFCYFENFTPIGNIPRIIVCLGLGRCSG